MVTSGVISVTATRKNQAPLSLSLAVSVMPRPGWTSLAPPGPVAQTSPLTKLDSEGREIGVYVPNSPEANQGGDGLSVPLLEAYVFDDEITRIADAGPNNRLWYVKSMRYNFSSFDYVLHPDVLNMSSNWGMQQTGTWTGIAACSITLPATGGFISAAAYRDGVIRHEADDQHSHWATFRAAINDPEMNIKAGVEALIGALSDQQSKFLADVRKLISDRRDAISATMAGRDDPWGAKDHTISQACPQWCDSTCTNITGRVNRFPYAQ